MCTLYIVTGDISWYVKLYIVICEIVYRDLWNCISWFVKLYIMAALVYSFVCLSVRPSVLHYACTCLSICTHTYMYMLTKSLCIVKCLLGVLMSRLAYLGTCRPYRKDRFSKLTVSCVYTHTQWSFVWTIVSYQKVQVYESKFQLCVHYVHYCQHLSVMKW